MRTASQFFVLVGLIWTWESWLKDHVDCTRCWLAPAYGHPDREGITTRCKPRFPPVRYKRPPVLL